MLSNSMLMLIPQGVFMSSILTKRRLKTEDTNVPQVTELAVMGARIRI